MTNTLAQARKNVRNQEREKRHAAEQAEVARLKRAEEARKAAEESRRREAKADAAERKFRQDEAPVVTLKYRGRTVTVCVADPDQVVRQTGVRAVAVIARHLSLDHEDRSRRSRQRAVGRMVEGELDIDQLLSFLLDGELAEASKHGLVEISK